MTVPKKRSNGEGALYPIRGGKLWRGVIDLGYHPDGRRNQASVTAAKKSDALAKLNALKAQIAEHGTPVKKTARLGPFANRWLEEVARPDIAPKTYADYRSLVNKWIVPTLGHRQVHLITPSDVRGLRRSMVDAGLTMSRVRQGQIVLSLVLDFAVAEKYLRTNPAADVKKAGGRERSNTGAAARERGALTTEQITAILRTSAALPDMAGARWWFRILTGTRQSEILGARLADLDLDTATYTVNTQLQSLRREHGCNDDASGRTTHPVCGFNRGASCPAARWVIPDGHEGVHLYGAWHLVDPKSNKGRVVPLVPQLTEVLHRHVEALDDKANPHGLLFPDIDGRAVIPKVDNDQWRTLLHAAGVITDAQNAAGENPYTGHWTRHSIVTVLASLGVDFQTIGELVGHSASQVTQMYRHVQDAEKKAAMDALGGAWAQALLPAQQAG